MREFWRGRRVLLTGHTGFKGTWAGLWLESLGADVTGLALAPTTRPDFWSIAGCRFRSIIGDVRDREFVRRAVAEANPEIVIHMAAQALVRDSYRDPVGTFATNVMGTAHLLDACRDRPDLRAVLIVTSDKVYDHGTDSRPFGETDRLGGRDPYSGSKAAQELVARSFRDSFFDHVPVATARAGNVIGGGDWAADRLVPDCARALSANQPVMLRNPGSIRPWQHVLEPVAGYLTLVEALAANPAATPRAINFGPDPASFRTAREVVDAFSARFDGRPGWVQDGGPHPVEAPTLTLSSGLAASALDWHPRLDFDTTMSWTAAWYAAHAEGQDMAEFSRRQLAQYQQLEGTPS